MEIKFDLPHFAIDLAAIGAVIGVLMGWVPNIAALMSLIWVCIKVWETTTFQNAITRLRERRRVKKLAKLKAKEKVLAARISSLDDLPRR